MVVVRVQEASLEHETMIDWGSRTRAGSIEVDYQTELQHLVTRVFIQVRVW